MRTPAAAAYLKATKIEPDSPKYLNNLGTSLTAIGAAFSALATAAAASIAAELVNPNVVVIQI